MALPLRNSYCTRQDRVPYLSRLDMSIVCPPSILPMYLDSPHTQASSYVWSRAMRGPSRPLPHVDVRLPTALSTQQDSADSFANRPVSARMAVL
jgi:hypothetical protein